MPREAKKRDVNEVAASVVARATTEDETDPYKGKNPAAVELGRLGGLKGGRARADRLSASQRSAIAKKAAQARWQGKRSDDDGSV